MSRFYRFSLGLLVMTLVACGGSDPASTSKEVKQGDEPVRPVRPLVFIGIDGAEWDVINPMMAAGEMPNLKALVDRGAQAHLLNPIPMVSPVVWTSFVTGHFGRDHGILDFVYPYVAGAKKPVESIYRQEPAVWNILSQAGKRVRAIGFFVSHPAEHVNGSIVSEFALQDTEGGFWPTELAETLAPRTLFPIEDRKRTYERFFPWPFDPAEGAGATEAEQMANELVRGRVSGRVIGDEYLRRVIATLPDEKLDFYGVYYRLPDVASHSLWLYFDDSDFEQKPDPELKALLGNIIPESYRYVDEALGELLARVGDDVNIVVVSDHGFGSSTGLYEVHNDEHKMLTGNHRPDGIFIAAGPDIVPGEYSGITVMEIMPTMMALMAQPVSDELPGYVYSDVIDPDFLQAHPLRYVDRYQAAWSANESVVDEETQAETMQTLQGLGYIGDGVEIDGAGTAAQYDFWSIEPRLISDHVHGEIVYYLLQGDEAAAEAVLNETAQFAPDVLPVVIARVRGKIRAIRAEDLGESMSAPAMESVLAKFRKNPG